MLGKVATVVFYISIALFVLGVALPYSAWLVVASAVTLAILNLM